MLSQKTKFSFVVLLHSWRLSGPKNSPSDQGEAQVLADLGASKAKRLQVLKLDNDKTFNQENIQNLKKKKTKFKRNIKHVRYVEHQYYFKSIVAI